MGKQDKIDTITINDVEYVRKDAVKGMAPLDRDGLKYCIVRTYSAGVFAGYIDPTTGETGVVRDARRLWYWDGAASLSQLSVDGVSKPSNCKFPCEVSEVYLNKIIEIIPCTQQSKDSIAEVPVWKK